jgi:phosphohistidine phosphatase
MTMGGNGDRKLVLLRHAKSAWPDVPDHERPLARRGQRDAPAMGRWLRAEGQVPDLVLCSTARRARETWQLAQAGLPAAPPVTFSDDVYGASAADLLRLARHTSAAVRTLLLVGHNPAIGDLAVSLAAGGHDAGVAGAAARLRAKLPTRAGAVLDVTGSWAALGTGSARLVRFVTPRDLASPGGTPPGE